MSLLPGDIEIPQLGPKMVEDNRGLPFTLMKLVRGGLESGLVTLR